MYGAHSSVDWDAPCVLILLWDLFLFLLSSWKNRQLKWNAFIQSTLYCTQ